MIKIGQYKKIRCRVCGASIEIWRPEEIPERCPACKEYFGDMLAQQGGGTGLTTARTYFHLDDEVSDTNKK